MLFPSVIARWTKEGIAMADRATRLALVGKTAIGQQEKLFVDARSVVRLVHREEVSSELEEALATLLADVANLLDVSGQLFVELLVSSRSLAACEAEPPNEAGGSLSAKRGQRGR
jgi:hypothetical protein